MPISLLAFACASERYCCDCAPDTDSPTPEVRLVQDTARSFHFQWGGPCYSRSCSGRICQSIRLQSPALEYVRSSFIIFREGQFKSLQIHVHRDSQISIEILPADARYSVPLPANPVSLADGGLPSHYARPDEAMLAGRPLKTLQTRKPVKTCLYKCRQPISHSSPSTSAPISHALPPTLLFSLVPIIPP